MGSNRKGTRNLATGEEEKVEKSRRARTAYLGPLRAKISSKMIKVELNAMCEKRRKGQQQRSRSSSVANEKKRREIVPECKEQVKRRCE